MEDERLKSDKYVLAVVDSPIQLLNTLNIMETTSYGKMKWDILILENSNFGRTIFDRISSVGIFRKTFFVEKAWAKLRELHKDRIRWSSIFLNKKNIYRIWPDLSCDFNDYQYMSFCPAVDFFVCNFAYLFNKEIRYIWLEDGLSSYANYGDFLPNKSMKDFARRILRHNSGKKNIECQYLYRPEMANYQVPFKRMKAPFLKPDSETAKMADVIFDFKTHNTMKEKYIYFDNAYRKDGIIANDYEILCAVSEIVGKDNLIIKAHPRNDISIYDGTGLKVCKNNYIPWEVYYFHEEMMRDKILIGAVGTALLSPYLYFDSKQRVISLVEMLETNEMNINFKNFIMYIKNNVIKSHPEIFFTPKNNKELMNYIRKINYV